MRLLAMLALTGTLAVTVLTGAAAPPAGLARFRENDLTYSRLGTFQGASEVWRSRVLLIGKAQTLGYGQVACVYVDDLVRQCTGTYILPRGRVSVGGELSSRQKFRLIIVGGTGAYAGASGELTAVGAGDSRVLTFNFGS